MPSLGDDRSGNSSQWVNFNECIGLFVTICIHPSRTGPAKRWVVDQRCLGVLFPVPMDIGGDELQPGHASILIHVEDDTRWFIAKEILGVGLWK